MRSADTGRRASGAGVPRTGAPAGHEPAQLQRLAHAAAGEELQHPRSVRHQERLQRPFGRVARDVARAAMEVGRPQRARGQACGGTIALRRELGPEQRRGVGPSISSMSTRQRTRSCSSSASSNDRRKSSLAFFGSCRMARSSSSSWRFSRRACIRNSPASRASSRRNRLLQRRAAAVGRPPVLERVLLQQGGHPKAARLQRDSFELTDRQQRVQAHRSGRIQQRRKGLLVEASRYGAPPQALPARGREEVEQAQRGGHDWPAANFSMIASSPAPQLSLGLLLNSSRNGLHQPSLAILMPLRA